MKAIELESAAEKPPIDSKKYLLQLNQINKQGYAISQGEIYPGALSISVPIKGYQFPAVLSVIGIESRVKPRLSELLPEVIASANRISSNLPNPG